MTWSAVCKRLQKRSFDLLSQRHGILFIILAIVIIVVAAAHFGESLVAWSADKYAAVVNSFSDNLAGRSFRTRLCLPVPIDIVYTWVNGSDPRLLDSLQMYKRTLSKELAKYENASTSVCEFESCIFANGIIVEPSLPSDMPLIQLALQYPMLSKAKATRALVDPVTGHNVTAVFFDDKEAAETSAPVKVYVNEQQATVRRLFYTTDKTLRNAIPSTDSLVMTGFPDGYDEVQLRNALPTQSVVDLVLYCDRGIAVLTIRDHDVFDMLLNLKNLTISGKSPTFSVANLVWDLTDYRHDEDISASRFEDNEELRYSLRSIERHAPWVRHIFIVTNGQIPSWLNLDHKRITVVSHEDIFPNKSHLPTFSSPAIESHLHRIYGLSDRFIYMNDDVLFGRDVWPDDFVSASGAQKVYLTWPVPNCREGCPASWISDGYCDRACNNSQCEWDGGDCANGAGRVQYPFYGGSGPAAAQSYRSTDLYCSSGCANNWIADRYCDQACNVIACGFDAADCGTDNFHRLHRVNLAAGQDVYDARGHSVIYFNVTALIGGESGSIASGSYSPDPIVRSASIARKFKVITVVMHSNHTERVLNFSISYVDNSKKNFTFNFSVAVDSHQYADNKFSESSHQIDSVSAVSSTLITEEPESFVFQFNASQLFPKPKHMAKVSTNQSNFYPSNFADYDLPDNILAEYKVVSEQLKAGDLSQTGFDSIVAYLWQRFVGQLKAEGRIPVLLQKPETEAQDSMKAKRANTSEPDQHQVKETYAALTVTDHVLPTDTFQHVSDRKNKTYRRLDSANNVHNVGMINQNLRGRRHLNSFEEKHRISDWNYEDVPYGFLPWEKQKVFSEILRTLQLHSSEENVYETNSRARQRHLLDTFADSLRHVSRVYNRAYGYTARRVPAHMPHMIDGRIMSEMQLKFPEEWDLTSSHRIRHSEDMQFAFSYFYFLMSEPANSTIEELFVEVDIDGSGILSDRELRILATRIYELPLDLKTLEGLELMLINCSQSAINESSEMVAAANTETYYEKQLPQVTLQLITQCQPVADLMKKQLKSRMKYKFDTVGEDDVVFKMLTANVSQVVSILDEIRRQPRKFICLNDNIDYRQDSAHAVKIVLRDFYEAFLPKPSSFELAREYRNRFLHINELRDWWRYRGWLRTCTQGVFVVAVAFTVISFFSDRIWVFRRRWLRR